MKIVLDTSIIIALLASDEEREPILEHIAGADWVCSESVTPEIGNAISAMFKRGRITLDQGLAMIDGFFQLEMTTMSYRLTRAIELSHTYDLYAYDAYVLECAERLNVCLITLDSRMQEVAQQLGISVIEV
jgi:predicted nucleic acid-binding protein